METAANRQPESPAQLWQTPLTEPSAGTVLTRILVACVGNIFLGDDGFGVEVARRLARRRFPPGVEVVDFGIRGLDLAYALLDGCETLILVDATPRGGTPGALYTLQAPTADEALAKATQADGAAPDGHSMDPMKVLTFAYRLGARPGRVLIVGCEPEHPPNTTDDMELREGLSEYVREAVEPAAQLVVALVERLLTESAAKGET